ncbi:MAG TPA: adenylate/guanylate cyclase domain-containing protein [Gaiellaceae bacterium]|nr:adenylate/guanylate cyclase domain-containing protein [Gaiellaceae bacterium]
MAAKGKAARGDRGPLVALAAVVALVPLALLAVFLGASGADVRWENHVAHFWLVLAAALVTLGLGYAVSATACRRRDARLFLISLAFMASFGFLALHALATPDVLLGKNAGFELATPVGLVVAGLLAAASAVELSRPRSMAVMRRSRAFIVALLCGLVLWGVISLTETWPLDSPLSGEQLDGWQVALAIAGIALFGAAALGYFRLYRRRRAPFVFAVTIALVLLAEAMVVIAWARNWHVSWWEWHLLMLLAFLAIALAARREWHEERFSALYLDETLAGARDVSILFADLAGFTPFSERHTPAAVTQMLNAYFGAIIPLMERAGGEVHQVVGDEVMVIFNKAGDQPDHAVVAARAALTLQETAAAVAHGHPDWPRFRAGVNSGEVLAGVVGGTRGHRKHGVVGDTVNLAARLQAEAPVGQVVLGAETVRRMPPGTVVERLPELRVKGKAEPVAAYVLKSST